jgi:hypothetical protein
MHLRLAPIIIEIDNQKTIYNIRFYRRIQLNLNIMNDAVLLRLKFLAWEKHTYLLNTPAKENIE